MRERNMIFILLAKACQNLVSFIRADQLASPVKLLFAALMGRQSIVLLTKESIMGYRIYTEIITRAGNKKTAAAI
jgi:hypothetical protein